MITGPPPKFYGTRDNLADRAGSGIRILGDQIKGLRNGIQLEKGAVRHMSDFKILHTPSGDHAGTDRRPRCDLRRRFT